MRQKHSRLNTALGTKIEALRKERNLTQEKLGDMMGVTFQQIQKYEHGKNGLSIGNMLKLCKIFGISPHDLIDWETTKKIESESVLPSLAERLVAKHGDLGLKLLAMCGKLTSKEAQALHWLLGDRTDARGLERQRRKDKDKGGDRHAPAH